MKKSSIKIVFHDEVRKIYLILSKIENFIFISFNKQRGYNY
jgi:hypothetical protein